jgi:hypothetical protein
MEAGMKKALVLIVLLLCAGVAALVVGWVQFALPQGQYGVMDTKTSGLIPTVFEAGNFNWRWERLIPTNSKLAFFSSDVFTDTTTITGTLPSASTYSSLLESKPDFAYSFTVTTSVRIKPEALVSLMEKSGVRTQDALDAALRQKTADIARATVEFLLSQPQSNPLQTIHITLDTDAIRRAISADASFADITLESVTLSDSKMPDIELYEFAKQSYTTYRAEINAAIRTAAESQALTMVKNNAALERLEKVAELLESHPTLAEIIVKNGDLGGALLSSMAD